MLLQKRWYCMTVIYIQLVSAAADAPPVPAVRPACRLAIMPVDPSGGVQRTMFVCKDNSLELKKCPASVLDLRVSLYRACKVACVTTAGARSPSAGIICSPSLSYDSVERLYQTVGERVICCTRRDCRPCGACMKVVTFVACTWRNTCTLRRSAVSHQI